MCKKKKSKLKDENNSSFKNDTVSATEHDTIQEKREWNYSMTSSYDIIFIIQEIVDVLR